MRFFILILFALSCAQVKESHQMESAHWDYQGAVAPYHWGELTKEFSSCGDGRQQSPINLSRKKARTLKQPIIFAYQDLRGEVVNNGHSIMLKFTEAPYVEMDGTRFFLRQLHFHAKSEHSLDGLFYPAELHIVHESKDQQLLVLGFLLEVDDEKFDKFGFFKSLPKVGETRPSETVQLKKLVDYNGGHFFYRGSLTTPPCTENVRWVIFDKHIKLSSAQLRSFESLYSNNYRPLMPLREHQLFHAE